jgi:hypothetical protein
MFNWLLSKLKINRIYNAGSLYMTRYYIFRKMFWWMLSIYIHNIHKSDPDKELHNHKWKYSISFILKGAYCESFRDKNDQVQTKIYRAGNINIIPANKFHKLELLTPEVWTLFISGPSVQDWGFWDSETKKYTNWKKFLGVE